jgi:hypothetical protein
VIRQELLDLGLLGDASGNIVFKGDVEFAGGTVVSGPSGSGSSISTGVDVTGAISDALGANVATSNDGDRLSVEDVTGENGTSPGTSILGRNGSGKAKFVQMRGNDILVRDEELTTAIFELREEIRELREILTSG